MTITPEEATLLTQLRKRLEADDIQLDWYAGHDDNLVRWIRAREWNVDRAYEMLKKNLEWRKQNPIEQVLTRTFPETLSDELPFQFTGFDSEGCPVVATQFGKWDMRKFVDAGKKQLILDFIEYLFEVVNLTQKSRSSPSKIYVQAVLILDYEGFSIRQMASRDTIDLIRQMLRFLESNQPETLKLGCIINAPRIFEMFFKLCKPLLTARTLAKIQVFGPNADNWKNFLRKQIPHSSIPSQYGGSNTSCFNHKITDRLLLPIKPSREFMESEMEVVEIEGGARHPVTVEAQAGKLLRWEFKTDRGEISFQMLAPSQGTVINLPKIDAHTFTQAGQFVCTNGGVYTFYFEHPNSRQGPIKLWHIVYVDTTDDLLHLPLKPIN